MAEMKHVGRYVQNQRKVAVAYRTVPQDSGYCLVLILRLYQMRTTIH